MSTPPPWNVVERGPAGIPTAVSLPAPDLLDATGAVKGAEDLSAMLEDAGLNPEQRTITCCGGGYYGALAALVLHLMGFEDVAMYDGALSEWTSDASNPVESSCAPLSGSRAGRPGGVGAGVVNTQRRMVCSGRLRGAAHTMAAWTEPSR